MDYPNDREVLENFDCSEDVSFTFVFSFRTIEIFWILSCRYRFSYVSRTLKALQISERTTLRIDDEGILSLQFLTQSATPQHGRIPCLTEFRVRGPAYWQIKFKLKIVNSACLRTRRQYSTNWSVTSDSSAKCISFLIIRARTYNTGITTFLQTVIILDRWSHFSALTEEPNPHLVCFFPK